MPCYRCGARQVDPVKGASPWQRGVKADRQVLICPGCQDAWDWTADLDRCRVCISVRLVRRLGEVECRDCGAVAESASGGGPAAADDMISPGLAEEVAQALARVLGRPSLSTGTARTTSFS
jgi:hypothetical protein